MPSRKREFAVLLHYGSSTVLVKTLADALWCCHVKSPATVQYLRFLTIWLGTCNSTLMWCEIFLFFFCARCTQKFVTCHKWCKNESSSALRLQMSSMSTELGKATASYLEFKGTFSWTVDSSVKTTGFIWQGAVCVCVVCGVARCCSESDEMKWGWICIVCPLIILFAQNKKIILVRVMSFTFFTCIDVIVNSFELNI